MPVLETIAYSLVIAWIMPAIVMRTEYFIRCIARYVLNSVPEELIRYDKDEKYHFVLNASVERIHNILKQSNYGLMVISAPPGTGKSTYLFKALQLMTPKRRMKIFIGGAYLQDFKYILSTFGIPEHSRKLSQYLPPGSVIIIDQVDLTEFNEAIRVNVIDLATDSHNSKKYLVILCLSNANFTRRVLDCNGGEKINLAVSPADLRWTRNDAIEFIGMKNIPENKIDSCLELFAPCYNPQIMRDYFNRKDDEKIIKQRTELKEECWKEFTETLPCTTCQRYLVPTL